ncbi:MAG: type IX secretion system sortase PorU [Fluviicola sp.]|nr:type IX secretion system sortase PorU [Fluviicola sp.]
MKKHPVLNKSLVKVFSLLIIFSSNIVLSQSEHVINLKWGKEKTLTQGDNSIVVPNLLGQHMDGNIPNYFWRKRLADNTNYSINLELTSTSPATSKEINYLKSQFIEVNQLKYDLKVAKSNTERNASLNLFPFIKENGQIKRINSVKISIGQGVAEQVIIQKDFVTNSVLQAGSGTWYKISVKEDGVHKIDKAFLEACGIDLSVVSPQDIHIFGNGDGRLPELNSVPRTDDLAENAIQIIGESDGSFDDGDYILFYGWGPHRWYTTISSRFNQDRNPYSDVSVYFINVNSALPPKRIQTMANSPSVVTNSVNTYSYYDVHELDAKSLVKGGQRWYGEIFDTQLQRSFAFNVPDIDNSAPANFEVSIASNPAFTSGTALNYSVNTVNYVSDLLPAAGLGDFGRRVTFFDVNIPSASMSLLISITRNSPDVLTYLDRIQLNARRNLNMLGAQFLFSDLNSVSVGNVSQFSISNFPTGGFVWDVTDRQNPFQLLGSIVGSNYDFIQETDTLRAFAVSDANTFLEPVRIGSVANQNLHGLSQVDFLIVTNKAFIAQAERLANLHRSEGQTGHVVTQEQVFNEFSSGAKDATAIRMFAKMFYDRGVLVPSSRPKSILLFGDGTYDPKNRVANNNNFIMTYQVLNSENKIAALVTDDYYGLLDDSESISSTDDLDINVGRMLVSDNEMAVQQVNKIEHYMKNGSSLYNSAGAANCNSGQSSTSTFGDWRTKYVQIADDEEGGYFIIQDVEPQFDTVQLNHPSMNVEKLYLDAYPQITTAGGERYPDVNAAIDKNISEGCLVINYVGHGGEVGVAEERVITVPMIQAWDNINRLALIVTATCEFTKYDDTERVSAGEWAAINPNGAAIALMTTTRSVFFGVNTNTGRAFYSNVFKREANGEPRTFGEIIRQTKNATGGSNNKRSFTLIGDPALKIALPRMNVITDSINGLAPSIQIDTLKALSKVTIKGHIEDFSANVLSGFNGFVYPTIYDKLKEQKTLGNNAAASPIRSFYTQTNKLYRGKATVTNGYFEFTFVVPKDINYSIGFGKLSYYAENGVTDALGNDKRVYIGGIDPNGINDTQGPDIEMTLNDDNFVNGGITDQNPLLIAKLFDENGINTVGNGVGHDLIAVLDGETGNPFVLNDYYIANTDSYQSGEVRFDFSDLEPGTHTLSLKVWDVNNNSSERAIDFVVTENEEMKLAHVLNYPNPFTTSTDFYFEHNQVCTQLEAQVQIMTVSGRLVKTINQYVNSEGFRSAAINWNGLDDFGDQLAKGVYVYRLKVTSPEGKTAEKLEKLVILK